MTITKDQMARALSEKTGYYLKNIKDVLSAMDDYVKEAFAEVTDDNDVSLQIVEGVKLNVKIVPERARKDPRTQEDIVCKPTAKLQAKFSEVFRDTIQKQYEDKKSENA